MRGGSRSEPDPRPPGAVAADRAGPLSNAQLDGHLRGVLRSGAFHATIPEVTDGRSRPVEGEDRPREEEDLREGGDSRSGAPPAAPQETEETAAVEAGGAPRGGEGGSRAGGRDERGGGGE